jgi:hypothetical protein
MWNLHWTGVRLPSPPLMKTKIILLSLFLLLNAVEIVRHNQILRFLIDGRPKQITYFHTTFMFTHIEIEVIEPEMRKDCAAFQSMNIYIFCENYDLHHTLHWRYIKFIET